MRLVARWTIAVLAGGVLISVGALIAQDALHRGVGEPTLWTTDAAGALWLVSAALWAASVLATSATRSVLLAVVVLAWVAPVFAWWADAGIPLLIAVAPATAALAVPALWQLLLDATAHRSRVRTFAIVAVWSVTLVAAAVLVLLRDPFLDAGCRGACTPNPVLVVAAPSVVASAHIVLSVLAAVVGVAAAAWSAVFRARKGRWMPLAPVPAIVTIALAAVFTLSPLAESRSPLLAWEVYQAAALALLAVASLWTSIAAFSRAAALRRLATDLTAGVAPAGGGDLRSRLALALHDPAIEVLYPLADGRWVDATGTELAIAESAVVTPVRRQGVTIARIVGRADGARDLEKIGAAAGLAIDNERLRAGISASLAELQASRLRVVEAGDEERRRIERNLHDGMQQSLLVLQYELGLAASQDDDPGRQAELVRLRGEAHGITERLRALARGVFPAALDDLGVTAALQRLADDAPFPLELTGDAYPRPPRPVERTLYLVADEALAAGISAPGTLTIAVERAADAVTMRIENSLGRASSTLRDRVEALGGRVASHDEGIEVLLPCG